MAMPVSLKAVADELGSVPDQMCFLINRKTGETQFLPHESSGLDSDEIDELREEIEGSDDWVELPGQWDRDDYRIMQNFARSYPDERIGDALLDAIQGKGAFRRFKDKVYSLGIEKQWFDFQLKQHAELVAFVLKQKGIAFIDDVGLPKDEVDGLEDDDD